MIEESNDEGYYGHCDYCGKEISEEYDYKTCWCSQCTPEEGERFICEECEFKPR